MMTQYKIGWAAYVKGKSISECTNDEQRRGWRAAWRAEGHALTSQVWGNASEVTA